MKLKTQRMWILITLLVMVTFGVFYLRRPTEATQDLQLVLRKIETNRITTNHSSLSGYDTEVVMHLRSQGPWAEKVANLAVFPYKESPNWGMSDKCEVFYKQNGKLKKYQWSKDTPSVSYPAAIYDANYGGFIRRYSLNIDAIPTDLGPLYCRIHTEFYIDVAKSWQGKNSPMKADAAVDGFIQIR